MPVMLKIDSMRVVDLCLQIQSTRHGSRRQVGKSKMSERNTTLGEHWEREVGDERGCIHPLLCVYACISADLLLCLLFTLSEICRRRWRCETGEWNLKGSSAVFLAYICSFLYFPFFFFFFLSKFSFRTTVIIFLSFLFFLTVFFAYLILSQIFSVKDLYRLQKKRRRKLLMGVPS